MAEPVPASVSALNTVLDDIGRAAVAVSGGVDSMTLALLAGRRLGADCAMFHAVSPAVPAEATTRVQEYAVREGWRLTVLDAGEFDDPAYRANPANRCFYCKTNLYGALAARTDATLLSGTNVDDLGDWRPGLKAAEAHGVRHPFVEAGIDKAHRGAFHRGGIGLRRPVAASGRALPLEPHRDRAPRGGGRSRLGPRRRALSRARQLRPETVRCRQRKAGIVIELDETTLGALSASRRAALGAAVAGMFETNDRTRPVSFAPYRTGSAFLRPAHPA